MPHFESATDLVIISSHHYGSDEVRTSKLMNEFALKRRVFFIESPIIGVSEHPTYFLKKHENEVTVIQPYLPGETSIFDRKVMELSLIKELISDEHISHYTIWTDTPQSMALIRKLSPEIIIYDCQKDYSATHADTEKELFLYADVVLTSGLASEVAQEFNKASGYSFGLTMPKPTSKLSLIQS